MLKTVYFDAHHRHKWQCFRIRLVDKVEATPPQNLASVLTSVIRRAVDNPASALVNGNYIAILFWGIVFGVICRSASYKVKDGLQGFPRSSAVAWSL